jgi:diguanylate cyclase (GGDEF)-like protein
MKERVNEALFRYMLSNAAIPLIGSSMGSLLIGMTLYYRDGRRLTLLWLLAVHLALVIRILIILYCRRRLVNGFDPHEARHFALTTGLSGIAWGMSGLLLEGADVFSAVLVITGVQAMVMGGTVTLGAFMPAFLAFSLPAILPMTGMVIWSGQIAIVAALYSTIFLGLMIVIAHRFNRSLRRTWRLTFEKEDLVRALTETSDGLARLARTDGLTGLANRNSFDHMLETEYARLTRSGAPLSIILLDVDHFKLFNDSYGHVAGDNCLKQVAQAFKETFHRAGDVAARYGGEEFIALLPELDTEGAIALAQALRERIVRLAIPHAASKTADYVTVSLGVVTVYCASLATPAEAVALADAQLYRAKSLGRNCVAHLPFCGESFPDADQACQN